jgi:hypothetical protein
MSKVGGDNTKKFTKTDKKVKVNNREAVVYGGQRGGEYVKMGGEFVNVRNINKKLNKELNKKQNKKGGVVDETPMPSVNELRKNFTGISVEPSPLPIPTDKELMNAIQNNNLETVRQLLDRGANLHANNEQSLRLATYESMKDMVRLLIDRGADPTKLITNPNIMKELWISLKSRKRDSPNSAADVDEIMKIFTDKGYTPPLTVSGGKNKLIKNKTKKGGGTLEEDIETLLQKFRKLDENERLEIINSIPLTKADKADKADKVIDILVNDYNSTRVDTIPADFVKITDLIQQLPNGDLSAESPKTTGYLLFTPVNKSYGAMWRISIGFDTKICPAGMNKGPTIKFYADKENQKIIEFRLNFFTFDKGFKGKNFEFSLTNVLAAGHTAIYDDILSVYIKLD